MQLNLVYRFLGGRMRDSETCNLVSHSFDIRQ